MPLLAWQKKELRTCQAAVQNPLTCELCKQTEVEETVRQKQTLAFVSGTTDWKAQSHTVPYGSAHSLAQSSAAGLWIHFIHPPLLLTQIACVTVHLLSLCPWWVLACFTEGIWKKVWKQISCSQAKTWIRIISLVLSFLSSPQTYLSLKIRGHWPLTFHKHFWKPCLGLPVHTAFWRNRKSAHAILILVLSYKYVLLFLTTLRKEKYVYKHPKLCLQYKILIWKIVMETWYCLIETIR